MMDDRSLRDKVIKGVSWLGIFKIVSQGISWVSTVYVARLLVPGDYGLMAMATIITGYAEMFAELGLGAAIIQRAKVLDDELCSLFWFSIFFCTFLGAFCFPLSYVTAWLMGEVRVIPITQSTSVLFVAAGLQIVPLNLLKEELDFKYVGLMELICTTTSCVGMVALAMMGAGVWTLVGGRMIRSSAMVVLLYYHVRWFPRVHFRLSEARAYINFGMVHALGRSVFYAWDKSDRFFAGRAWEATQLGYYTLARQLAEIPTEKVVSLVNQVCFSAMSQLQNEDKIFRKFYLEAVKGTGFVVLPLFVGGFLVGDDIVKVLLNEQWYEMAVLFRYLCLAQIMTGLNAINNFVHAALGRPRYGLLFHALCAGVMPLSFYLAVKQGLTGILVPWLSIYVLLCSAWIIFTIRSIKIRASDYVRNFAHPLTASGIMGLCVWMALNFMCGFELGIDGVHLRLVVCAVLGSGVYVGYFWLFDRRFVERIFELTGRKKRACF